MSDLGDDIRDILRKGLRQLDDLLRTQEECGSEGHPYYHDVLDYSAGEDPRIHVQCSNCKKSIIRKPTEDERSRYGGDR